MKIKKYFFLILLIGFFGCSSNDSQTSEEEIAEEEEVVEEIDNESVEDPIGNTPNILLVISDDMGLDATPGYVIGDRKPNMPNLESLISNGITFNNVWANPSCTPTRGTILTGKYGFRTNVLKVYDQLATSETSIQRYLDENSNEDYSHAVIGKWHLSRDTNHPLTIGANYFAGLLTGGVEDYENWSLIENGITTTSTEYTTTKLTDLAIDWVDNQTKPWFLWLAYNAPHTPFHAPPSNLHTQGSLPEDQASINANSLPYYLAAMEAMDTEMGRLLASMSQAERENTIIIFLGDNGTPNQVRQEYANRRVKGSVYQGGVNVPMVVSGALVERANETEDALINTTDIFATVANIAGVNVSVINDSHSFKNILDSYSEGARDYVYAEIGLDTGGSDYTIRNATHKYILFGNGDEALYNLSNDALEVTNLLAENQLPLSNANMLEMEQLIQELESIRN